MSEERIQPRLLKGFRDMLPAQEAERRHIMHTLAQTFTAFGFVPIDTPILEYTEILLGKGGGETDKQIFRFKDNGGRDVAMRFDLTVPFARFMAMHAHELYLPFKRFHMAKAFRGENTQRGRYREFMQCDFDIVGTDSASADFEVVLLLRTAFAAIGVDGTTVRLSHRGLFNRLLETHGVTAGAADVLRIVDKLRKIGKERVATELTKLVGEKTSAHIVEFISCNGTNEAILKTLGELVPSGTEELQRLTTLMDLAATSGIAKGVVIDPSITRGLDYYTGVVFETFLDDLPEIGSVGSGGRYDNLASLYTKEQLPGVGGSIGLDRLMAALEDLGKSKDAIGGADVMVLCQSATRIGDYHRTARALREHGVRVDVFPEPRKLSQQFVVAEKKSIPTALFVDDDELVGDSVKVRSLRKRENSPPLSIADAAALIRQIAAEK